MPVRPFTSAGVSQKTADLYALSDNNLLVEANAIKSDLRAWLNVNFTLTTAEQSYISGMDDRFIDALACRLSLAVSNRLSVTMTAPTPLPPPTISKLVRQLDTIKIEYNQSTGYSITGTMSIILDYSIPT